MEFPEHKCGLYLSHNDHKNHHETVRAWIKNLGYKDDDWISEEQKKKAIATNECWSIHWYPETPDSFHVMLAADLQPLLDYVIAAPKETGEIK
jgi:hypothetical protein